MGRGCGKLSFCAHDGPGAQGGVEYMWNILGEMDRIMQDPSEGVGRNADFLIDFGFCSI